MAKFHIRYLAPLIFMALAPLWGQNRPLRATARIGPQSDALVQGVIQAPAKTGNLRTPASFTLNSASGTVVVHIGRTAGNLRAGQAPLDLVPGDAVAVKGSWVNRGGTQVLLAREIRKGDRVWTIRNANGIPVQPTGQDPFRYRKPGGNR